MIKILHFISDSNVGGAGKLLCNLIENMDNSKFKTAVALPKASALIPLLEPLPCEIIKLNSEADRSFSSSGFAEAIEIIKKLHPDIVHSHASLSSRLAAMTLGIPCRIFTKHCAFPASKVYHFPPVRLVSRMANGLISTSVIATADSARRTLIVEGYDKDRITTILNGTPPLPLLSENERSIIRVRYGLNKDDFVISIFARLEEYKGHKTLLEAAKICKRHYPSFKFFIVGDGRIKDDLIKYAKALKIEDTVYFTGFLADVSKIFNVTDVNVNCSTLSETSNLSLCEGMSLGIPCVASDCSGNPQMVENAKNGLLFPTGNADALAECLMRLYRDKALYKKCSLGAYKRYKDDFSAHVMAEKMMTLYKNEYKKSRKSRKNPLPLR